MKRNLIIWGAGGHAMVLADIVRQLGDWTIAGFVDDINPERQGGLFLGSPILQAGQIERLARRRGGCDVVIGIGNCRARWRLSEAVQARDFRLVTLVHPRATVASGVEMGPGTVVAAGAVINPGCVIGRSVIINTGASVDHGSTVGDAAHVCPGVTLAGEVSIGARTWIGIGSTVIERINVGTNCLVGAGSLVLDDIPVGVVAYGSPARVIRQNIL